jgi:membrane protease YdiL (CAAX protease family)
VARDEARIIGNGQPTYPPGATLARFLLEEVAWLLAAFADTVLAAQIVLALGGRLAAGAPGVALFGLHLLVGAHVLRCDRARLPAWLRPSVRHVAWGLAGGIALLAFNGAYGWLLDAVGIPAPDVAALLRTLLPQPALVLWAAGVAPLVEELYFRGRLLGALDARMGAPWAGVTVSVAFALIHGIPAFIPAYLVFAGILLALRRHTGGLVAPIVAHVVNNGFALI